MRSGVICPVVAIDSGKLSVRSALASTSPRRMPGLLGAFVDRMRVNREVYLKTEYSR